MPKTETEELLILAKTYPSPSTQYRETTCVAAVTSGGQMRRLFPVPYRLLDGDAQFKKWEWITARVVIPTKDRRPESRRIDADSIIRSDRILKVKHGDWSERIRWIMPHIVSDFPTLEARRQATGQTLGFIRAARIQGLHITKVREPEWSEAELIRLRQEGLFDSEQVKARRPLRKLPYDFHYTYDCNTPAGTQVFTHKLTDWEIGALFWNCIREYGPAGWEAKFRHRLEEEFSKKDLLFLMGTVHRFPDQWLIVGIVYPPKPAPGTAKQFDLSLGL